MDKETKIANSFINYIRYMEEYLDAPKDRRIKEQTLLMRIEKVKKVIRAIIDMNRDYLLTYDYCYFLVYFSYIHGIKSRWMKDLKNIMKSDMDSLVIDRANYCLYIIHSHFAPNILVDGQFVDLMSEEDKELFNRAKEKDEEYKNVRHDSYGNPLLISVGTIISVICGYCYVYRKYDSFEQLFNKVFDYCRLQN